jgi:hypothetical protein
VTTTVTPATPVTAAGLLAAVVPCEPTVEDGTTAFALDPPAALDPRLRVLHTGVRAVLTGRPWYGCGSDRRTAAPRVLDPAARLDHPALFAAGPAGR